MVNLIDKTLVKNKRQRVEVALLVLALVITGTCLAVMSWQLSELANFSLQVTHHMLFTHSK